MNRAARFLFSGILFASLLSSTALAAKPPASKKSTAAPRAAQTPVQDSDQTLHAMRDEMARSVSRMQIPGAEKPFYIQYQLLDLDIREITGSFGALLSSSTTRNRFMLIGVRIGDYHLDSSNFVTEDGFRGFLGSAGQVGIDRDYNSLRQDLWLSTDQAYKEALTSMSLKRAFLRSLTKPPEIDDFSQVQPVVQVEPRLEPDWTSRNWEDEVRESSRSVRGVPELKDARVTYYLIYATYYLLTSEGTEIRISRSFAGIEGAMDALSDDGMQIQNFYSKYVGRPADLPSAADVSKELQRTASEVVALRTSPLVPDFTGPILFDAPASGSLLAQTLAASISGARPPLSMVPRFDEIMEGLGGRSEWTGRVNTRVLPASVSLTDDPSQTAFNGQPLIGGYGVDDEGVRAQRVSIVEDGMLRNLLMSRRPGPESQLSNGHARAAILSTPKPLSSNLTFQSNAGLSTDDLKKKFLQMCKDDGHEWCIEVRRMDNPALSSVHAEDFNETIGGLASGIGSGTRLPLILYRVYVADGREELVRGGLLNGLTLRSLRNIAGIGSDLTVFNYVQNPAQGFAGTALGAFGSAQDGIPSSITAPSLLLEEGEVRGFHGEPRRLPLVTEPPLQ
jgi:TldD protein